MKEIKLDFPLDVNGAKVNALHMRRPTLRDMKAAQRIGKDNPVETEALLFANLCEVPPGEFDEIDMVDYEKIQEAYTDFLSTTTT